jgi:RHS repeat-associated protein
VEFAYAGRPFEARTGLSDNRARWYEPGTGRFVNEDPSGFKGGDANLFRYVGNDPLNQVDPSGLAAKWASGAKASVPTAGWAALGQQNALSMYSLYGSLGKAAETAAAERTRDKQEAAQFAAASTGLAMALFTGKSGVHDLYADKGFPTASRPLGASGAVEYTFRDGTRYMEPREPSTGAYAGAAATFLPAYRVAATGASALNVARVAVGNVSDDVASGYASRAASDATGGRLATVPLPIGSMVMGGAVCSAAAAGARPTLAGPRSTLRTADEIFSGVRQASKYLQEMGVSRAKRVEYLQAFEAGTISFRPAGASEYGLRYFGGRAKPNGGWVFETFPASRQTMALDPDWNAMNGFRQFRIVPGTPVIQGRAAAQGPYLPGGQVQKFILDWGNGLTQP